MTPLMDNTLHGRSPSTNLHEGSNPPPPVGNTLTGIVTSISSDEESKLPPLQDTILILNGILPSTYLHEGLNQPPPLDHMWNAVIKGDIEHEIDS
jgi:hypothetical protein